MDLDPNEQWARVTIDETLVGRKAGSSAAEKAKELRDAAPIRSRMARVLRVHTDERAWRVGASGERTTAFWFKRLGDGWHVFHDIPVGERGANIDHLVIGPAGVFTVNTKNLTGKVWLASRALLHNGRKTSYLPKATAEAKRAARLLSAAVGHPVTVRPVLALMVDEWTVKERPTDVYVDHPRVVKNWMVRQPASLSSAEVLELSAAAAIPTTWS